MHTFTLENKNIENNVKINVRTKNSGLYMVKEK